MLEEELQTKLSFRQWEKIPLKIGDAFLCMHIFMCCFINVFLRQISLMQQNGLKYVLVRGENFIDCTDLEV